MAQRVLEQQADDPGRDRAHHEQPAEAGVGVSAPISRARRERPMPRTIRTQSLQKKPSNTSAVARCVATRNARKKSSFWWMSQPSSRQDHAVAEARDGKSSAMPWSRPRTTAWKYEIRAAGSGVWRR